MQCRVTRAYLVAIALVSIKCTDSMRTLLINLNFRNVCAQWLDTILIIYNISQSYALLNVYIVWNSKDFIPSCKE